MRDKLNKNLVILGMIVLLLTVGLSGCTEQSDDDDNNGNDTHNLEIAYAIETLDGSHKKIEDGNGFLHGENVYSYKISGKVRNTEEKTIGKIKLIVDFYDSNNDFLISESIMMENITNTYTYFILFFTRYDYNDVKNLDYETDIMIFYAGVEMRYFENFDHLLFEYQIL